MAATAKSREISNTLRIVVKFSFFAQRNARPRWKATFFQGRFGEMFLERNEEPYTEHQDACPDERKPYDCFLVAVMD